MKHLKTFLLLTYISLLPWSLKAQNEVTFSQHVETGSRAVFCMKKASDGILWTGTSLGLLTSAQLVGYTGYTRYPRLNNVIENIQEDNLQRLWLKTQSNCYLVYTPKTNELIADARPYLKGLGMNVVGDYRVSIDTYGKAWVFSERNIWVYDFKTKFSKKMTLPKSTGFVVGIEADSKGAVIVTQGAIYLSSTQNLKIQPRFYAKTDKWLGTYKKLINRSDNGMIWLYSEVSLRSLNPVTKQWTIHSEVFPNVTCMVRPRSDGYLLVGTTNAGIYVFDQQGKLVRHLLHESPTKADLASNHIESLYYNPATQTLMVAYHKHDLSLFSLSPRMLRTHYVQSSSHMFLLEDVISFCSADANSFWVGTEDNGIYRIKNDGTDEILEERFPKTAATAMIKDSEGKLWTGLYNHGLVCGDGRKFFPNYSPYNIIEVSPSRFFVLLNGEGLWALNPRTGDKQYIPMENKWIVDMARIGDKIYAPTPKFLNIVDVHTLQVKKVPAARFHHSDFRDGNKAVIADSRKWIWLVNYKGHSPVDIYDTNTGRTFQCTPLKDYDVYSLVEDKHGHIWCATDKGLVMVKVKSKQEFETYCFEKRGKILYNFRALRRIGDQLVVGHTQGFNLVNPDVLEKSIVLASSSERLILSALRINEEYISPGQELDGKVIVDSDLPYLRHLDLSYDQNNIMMECYPKTLVENERSRYYYKLKGLDEEWIPIDNHVITLSNVPSGDYELLIKESDINKHDFTEYELCSITIHSPFWATPWAYLLYLVLLATMITYIYRFYENRKKYRDQINELMLKAEMEAGITPTKVEPVTMDEKLIADAVKVVEENMGDPNFTVEVLSEKLNMHRTNLYKKLQFLTGKTPLQFIRLMRLKRGKQLLSRGNVLVSQVAYEVGFNDPKKFARYFKEEFGMYPSEYMKKQSQNHE